MQIGDRVRVGVVSYATLPNPCGTITGDDHDGYWIVTLDEPGFQLGGIADEDVPFVIEHEDNLTLIPSFPTYDDAFPVVTSHLPYGKTRSFLRPRKREEET